MKSYQPGIRGWLHEIAGLTEYWHYCNEAGRVFCMITRDLDSAPFQLWEKRLQPRCPEEYLKYPEKHLYCLGWRGDYALLEDAVKAGERLANKPPTTEPPT